MKRLIIIFMSVLFFALYISSYTLFLDVPTVNVFDTGKRNGEKPADSTYEDKEAALLNFMEKRMIGEDGRIYTNSNSSMRNEGALSESAGLLMNYCIIRDDKELFDRELSYIRKHLLTDGNYIRWKDSKEESASNALIDDLRIVRALMDAYDNWGNRNYLDTAGFIQQRIYEKQVEGDYIYELYDWNAKKSKKTIPLCYLDLYTMNRLGEFNKGWIAAADKSKSTIAQGQFGEKSPFFYKYYDYRSKKYLPDEEYKKDKGICLTYTLYTALHLAEMNEDTGVLTDWLSKEMNKGKLYAWYDPENLKPVNDIESTAVYALAAVYSKKVGEEELYHKLIDRMLVFRITDIDSPNCGGFGNDDTGDFYSFDNLTALWALAVE